MRFLIVFILLFLALMIFTDHKPGISYSSNPQFTDEQMHAICIEEGI